MMKDIKETVKNTGKKVGDFVKERRGAIAFAAGIGIGSYIGYKTGVTTFGMAVKMYIPEAWEIITNYYNSSQI